MLNQYKATYLVTGHYTCGKPGCPPWDEYDASIEDNVEVEIWAKSKEDARRLAEDYWFQMRDWPCSVDSRELLSVEFVRTRPDRSDEEEGIIDF